LGHTPTSRCQCRSLHHTCSLFKLCCKLLLLNSSPADEFASGCQHVSTLKPFGSRGLGVWAHPYYLPTAFRHGSGDSTLTIVRHPSLLQCRGLEAILIELHTTFRAHYLVSSTLFLPKHQSQSHLFSSVFGIVEMASSTRTIVRSPLLAQLLWKC